MVMASNADLVRELVDFLNNSSEKEFLEELCGEWMCTSITLAVFHVLSQLLMLDFALSQVGLMTTMMWVKLKVQMVEMMVQKIVLMVTVVAVQMVINRPRSE